MMYKEMFWIENDLDIYIVNLICTEIIMPCFTE